MRTALNLKEGDAVFFLGGKPEQFIETAVKFEDGRTGKVSANLKILDAKIDKFQGDPTDPANLVKRVTDPYTGRTETYI